MAVTIFHKVIYNKVTIINRNPNKEEKPKETHKKLNAKLRLNRHTRSEIKTYD